MKARYYCDHCGMYFDDADECVGHEALHADIERIMEERPSKYEVGDRIRSRSSSQLRRIESKSYDLCDGWVYNIGYDAYDKPIQLRESAIERKMSSDDIHATEVALTRRLHASVSEELYARCDSEYTDELSFIIRCDRNMPHALRLLRAHLEEESGDEETTRAMYFLNRSDVRMVEVSTSVPTTGECMFCSYPPSMRYPVTVGFAIVSEEDYARILDGTISLPDGLDMRDSIDLMEFVKEEGK